MPLQTSSGMGLLSKCSELNKGAFSTFVPSSRYWTNALLMTLLKNRAVSAIVADQFSTYFHQIS
jgi:hypothetical protein